MLAYAAVEDAVVVSVVVADVVVADVVLLVYVIPGVGVVVGSVVVDVAASGDDSGVD